MPRFTPVFNNFTSGEFSPRLQGRVDIERYYNAARQITNAIVLQQGGVTKRTGTVWTAETKDSTKKSRLIPFEFNVEQAYILELGDQYVRFYRNQGQIVDLTDTITNITQANPAVVTATAHGFSNGDQVVITDVIGMTEVNNLRFTVANAGVNDFELSGTDSTGFTAYSSGGVANRPYEVATPWLEAELFELQFTQSADTLYVVHPNHQPRKITRTGHTAWTVTLYAPTANPFTGANDFPSTVTLFEQRIIFAATNNEPNKLFASQSGNFENMTVGTADSDGYEYVIASGRVNRIRWLSGGRQLAIGTAGDEYTETGGASQPVTPTNVDIHPQTNHGSANLQPVDVGSVILFVQRSGKRLREFTFVFETDAFEAPDLLVLADHLTGCDCASDTSKVITQMSYQREPVPVIWATTEDGRLLGMTYERSQSVVAWHEHFDDANTVIDSVASIPRAGGEETWIIAKRTINGTSRRYVEYLHPGSDILEDMVFVDSSFTYSGTATTSITGLGPLEGEEVAIMSDGAVHPRQTVTSGAITLQDAAEKVHVGIPYTATVETLPVAAQGQGLLGRKISFGAVRIHLYQTVGLVVNDVVQVFRTGADEMNQPVPLFTGVIETHQVGWATDQDKTLVFQSTQPLPFTLIAASANAEVSDE